MWWKDKDLAPRNKEKHNTPRVRDSVYIAGKWVGSIYVKSMWTRVNGTVTIVDYLCEEATILFQDHPYADKDEPKIMRIGFDVFYGRWDANKECFILTDDLL